MVVASLYEVKDRICLPACYLYIDWLVDMGMR